MKINEMFEEFAEVYRRKIDNDYSIKLQFEITDVEADNLCQIDVNNGHVHVYNEVTIEPEECFIMKFDTLEKLYHGKLSPLTAFANEPDVNGEMTGLIDLKYKTKDKFGPSYVKKKDDLQNLFQRLHKFDMFFDRNYPTKVIIDLENSRKIHGVDAIGLCSIMEGPTENGLLHVFFSIQQNEVLKQAPLAHSVYILQGSGVMTMDGEEYEIKSKEYYRINPKSKENVLFKNDNEEPLELLYI